MRNCIILVLLSALALLAPVHSANAQSRGRYTAVTNAVFSQPPYNGDPAMLEQYGHKTAGELGYAGKEVYNEYPEGPHVVILSASALIYYDAASGEPMYLDGCRKAGKPWYNRLKLVERIITVEKIVEKPVERIVERQVPVEVPVPCPTCEVQGVTIDTYASKGSRFWGGLLETGISVGTGMLSSGLFSDRGQRGRSMRQSALASGVSGRVAQFFNPDDNRARVTVSLNTGGAVTLELKKGKSLSGLPAGGSANWNGDSITVTIPNCGTWSASPHTGFNFMPVPIIRQNVFVDQPRNPRVPVKTYPGPPGPGIPGTTAPKASSRRIGAAWQ